MTTTTRAVVQVAIAGLLLLVSALAGRIEPMVLAVPLLVSLLLGLLGGREPRLDLERSVSTRRVFEGEEIVIELTIRAVTSLPLLEISGPLPEGAILTRGSPRAFASLAPGQSRGVAYAFRMPHRSRFDLTPHRVRAHTASALSAWERTCGETMTCVVYPAPAPLRAGLRPTTTRAYAGSYVSPAPGEGIDFLDLRAFRAGDHTRRINWRATARRDEIVVNRYAAERSADVILLMDAMTEAGEPGASVLDHAARGAAALARAYLREKNRVGYVEMGRHLRWLEPATGSRQWFRILDCLSDLGVHEGYLTFEVSSVPSRVLPRGAFVVVWSPLVNRTWTGIPVDLARRGYDLAVITPWAPAIAGAALPRGRISELGLRIWEIEQRTTLEELRRIGVACVAWTPGEPLDLPVRMLDRSARAARR